MSCNIAGRVIALSEVKTVASSDPSKQPMKKRELYMDCTRFDGLTGEQIGKENKILLEFGGDKVLEKFDHTRLQKGDIISVEFDLVGNQYTDKATGKMRVFTAIRCYDFTVKRRSGEQMVLQPAKIDAAPTYQAPPVAGPTPPPAPEPQPQPQGNSVFGDPIPEPNNNGLPF